MRIPLQILVVALAWLHQSSKAGESYVTSVEPGGLISGEVKIKNMKVTAVFDTGGSNTLISTHLAENYALDKLGVAQARALNGIIEMVQFSAPELFFGAIKPVALPYVAAFDTKTVSEVAGFEIGLIVGMDFLRDHCMDIDYDSGKVTIGDFADFEAKTINYKKWNLLDASRGTTAVELPGFKHPLLFDTGSTAGVGLGKPIFDEFLTNGSAKKIINYRKKVSVAGLSAPRSAWCSRFVVDGPTIIPVLVNEIDFGDGDPGDDAMIGMQVIQNWNWVLDFSTGTAYYSPSRYFGKPVLPDASGLGLLKTGTSVFVGREPPDHSPAASAGIQLKDELVEINGTASDQLSLTAIRRILCDRSNVKVNLVFMRDGNRRSVDIVLQSPLDAK
jgi:hypothetical protein